MSHHCHKSKTSCCPIIIRQNVPSVRLSSTSTSTGLRLAPFSIPETKVFSFPSGVTNFVVKLWGAGGGGGVLDVGANGAGGGGSSGALIEAVSNYQLV
jgi:hypothetical protein